MSHKLDSVKFAGWAFVDLFILFSALYYFKPAVGLAGLGSILILASMLVLANHKLIWHDYLATFRKTQSSLLNRLQEPKPEYYRINIYIIWPAVMVLGFLAIYAAMYI